MREPGPARPTAGALAPWVTGCGGGLLVASVFGPMASHGVGSAISGRGLASLLLGGAVSVWAPRRSGVLLYLQPVCGALVLLGSGVGGRIGRITVAVAAGISLLGAATLAVALEGSTVREPGWGSLAVHGGLAMIGLGAVAHRRSRRPRGVG